MRRSSVVERPLMVQWVVGSIPDGGSIESMTGVTKAMVCYSVCGMMHLKEPLQLIKKIPSFIQSGAFP